MGGLPGDSYVREDDFEDCAVISDLFAGEMLQQIVADRLSQPIAGRVILK